MSSFVVKDQTINVVVNWIARTGRNENRWLWRELGKLDAGINPETNDNWDRELAARIASLNRLAVYDRYGEADDVEPLRYQWDQNADLCQTYKSLSCWLYQCAEGSIPENPLYKFFKQAKATLADDIIHNLPEFSTAKWG